MLHKLSLWKGLKNKPVDVESFSSTKELPSVILAQRKWNTSAIHFLSIMIGKAQEENMQPSETQDTYLSYVDFQVSKIITPDFSDVLTAQNHDDELSEDGQDIFNLLVHIANLANDETQLSVDRTVDVLVEKGSFVQTLPSNEKLRDKARCLVFFLIGHIFLLYPAMPPPFPSGFDHLVIDPGQAACMAEAQSTGQSNVSIGEALHAFGLALPSSVDESRNFDYPDMNIAKDLLYIALLNVFTLTTVGGIRIVWVNNISSHLVFDSEKQELMVFVLPSFCDIIVAQATPLSRIMNTYYDEYDKPPTFTLPAMMKEIRLSYRLLFGESARSRRLYEGLVDQAKKRSLSIDPFLTSLCGAGPSRRGGSRHSYSKSSEFPILNGRLSTLQDYILRRNPDSLQSIWYDRRDVLKWYTFWAVVFLGGAGLILSALQVGLAIAQVAAQVTTSN